MVFILQLFGELRTTEQLQKLSTVAQTCPHDLVSIRHLCVCVCVCAPPVNEVAGMFSQASVCPWGREVGGLGNIKCIRDRSHGRVPPRRVRWVPSWASNLRTYPLLVASGGDHWRPVQTCSFGDLAPGVISGGGN